MNAKHFAYSGPGLTQEKNGALVFDDEQVLQELKYHLPAQAPLKDFVHHNTLHAFQNMKFFDALKRASVMFGYKVTLSIEEFRRLYQTQQIREEILDRIIEQRKDSHHLREWKQKLISKSYTNTTLPRIGQLRAGWKKYYHIDLDSLVHPTLFRVICSYLDQGIAMWNFPVWHQGFLASIRELERNSFTSFFRGKRAKKILKEGVHDIASLLKILIGNKSLYKQYLFDQQFAHQGWSGMVASIEDQPDTLADKRNISLHDVIYFELLLEIDALDSTFGDIWSPLALKLKKKPVNLFSETKRTEFDEVLSIWQEAFEWNYYDQALSGIISQKRTAERDVPRNFQALFCVDDRSSSFRHYLETSEPSCETFGTPGFFNVEFFFKPANGKFYTKLCPAPVTPKHVVMEQGSNEKNQTDVHFNKHSHTLFRGVLITQTLGFISALRLLSNIFWPKATPAAASSFRHMNRVAALTIENKNLQDTENGLQIGFTIEEMAQRVENLLRGIGLVKDFAPLVYIIGHGSSSVNNPHYAAYDCGACAGRPGSVNARVICFMANHAQVRSILSSRGVTIPPETLFIGGLQDTTRDEIEFFDEDSLNNELRELHQKNVIAFSKALDANAKERSRRFESINTRLPVEKIHEKIRARSVSLFETRPELNHATNSLCVVGRRSLTKSLFLDRRAFLNSYDYTLDQTGDLLFKILKPIGPICGGINLEYYFSRVDNQKLGAGTKLPHNVMGLFAVANGIEGDLRPGLPSQMIEVHDPLRLMVVVEQLPRIVLETIQRSMEVYEWFINEWIHLAVFDPSNETMHIFQEGVFRPYNPLQSVDTTGNVPELIESTRENIPVHIIKTP